ncbi:hypothetical protein Z962_11360 [Clostridium botulinum C/D str. BKT12695]|nr:hypothetical protein Z962_11360 [Clostridium botulinum C/D str. BKT12695]
MKMKRLQVVKENYNAIVDLGVRLSKEHKDQQQGLHDYICINKDGEIYNTGLKEGVQESIADVVILTIDSGQARYRKTVEYMLDETIKFMQRRKEMIFRY